MDAFVGKKNSTKRGRCLILLIKIYYLIILTTSHNKKIKFFSRNIKLNSNLNFSIVRIRFIARIDFIYYIGYYHFNLNKSIIRIRI